MAHSDICLHEISNCVSGKYSEKCIHLSIRIAAMKRQFSLCPSFLCKTGQCAQVQDFALCPWHSIWNVFYMGYFTLNHEHFFSTVNNFLLSIQIQVPTLQNAFSYEKLQGIDWHYLFFGKDFSRTSKTGFLRKLHFYIGTLAIWPRKIIIIN